MQVHPLAEAATSLAGVHEQSGELVPEVDVVRATAPFPVLDTGNRILDVRATALMGGVARARLDQALGAGSGHRVRHPGAGDCVDERRLPET